MRTVEKKVYYCDHCGKHRLSRVAMEKHERHCTLNPERTCRWKLLEYESTRSNALYGPHTHTMRKGLPRWLKLRRPITKDVIAELRDYCEGCPACMLAAVRQAQLEFSDYDSGFNWWYEKEVERYREDERFYYLEEERREIEATFL